MPNKTVPTITFITALLAAQSGWAQNPVDQVYIGSTTTARELSYSGAAPLNGVVTVTCVATNGRLGVLSARSRDPLQRATRAAANARAPSPSPAQCSSATDRRCDVRERASTDRRTAGTAGMPRSITLSTIALTSTITRSSALWAGTEPPGRRPQSESNKGAHRSPSRPLSAGEQSTGAARVSGPATTIPIYSAAALCRCVTSSRTPTRSALPDPRTGNLSTTITSAGASKSGAPLLLA